MVLLEDGEVHDRVGVMPILVGNPDLEAVIAAIAARRSSRDRARGRDRRPGRSAQLAEAQDRFLIHVRGVLGDVLRIEGGFNGLRQSDGILCPYRGVLPAVVGERRASPNDEHPS